MKVFLTILIIVSLIVGFVGMIIIIDRSSTLGGIIWLLAFIQLAILFYIPQLAMSKGYSGILSFLLALFVPLFGSLIIVALLPDNSIGYSNSSNNSFSINNNHTPLTKPLTGDTWTCKKCGEINRSTSSSCKGCGEYR